MSNTDDVLTRLVARAVREEIGDELNALRDELASLRRAVQALASAGGNPIEARAGSDRRTRVAERPISDEAPSPKAIRALREKLGLTQADFARLAGVSSVAVYFWETGRTTPRGRTVEALAAVADLSPDRARQRLSSGELPTRRTRAAGPVRDAAPATASGRRARQRKPRENA